MRHRGDQLRIEADFPLHDAARQRQRELHHLALALLHQRLAQAAELFERLRDAAQHRFRALAARFEAGAFALRIALGERFPFERGQPFLLLNRQRFRRGRRGRRRGSAGAAASRGGGGGAPRASAARPAPR